jgi:hypothetical protein
LANALDSSDAPANGSLQPVANLLSEPARPDGTLPGSGQPTPTLVGGTVGESGRGSFGSSASGGTVSEDTGSGNPNAQEERENDDTNRRFAQCTS